MLASGILFLHHPRQYVLWTGSGLSSLKTFYRMSRLTNTVSDISIIEVSPTGATSIIIYIIISNSPGEHIAEIGTCRGSLFAAMPFLTLTT